MKNPTSGFLSDDLEYNLGMNLKHLIVLCGLFGCFITFPADAQEKDSQSVNTPVTTEPGQEESNDESRELTEFQHPLAEKLSDGIGHPFKTLTSSNEHWYLIHDTEDTFARQFIALLEFTYDIYFEMMNKRGITPHPPKEPLICVFVRDFKDYEKYGEIVGHPVPKGASGFYSFGTNQIAFFDTSTGPNLVQIVNQINNFDQQIDSIREQMRSADRTMKPSLRDQMTGINKQKRFAVNKMREYQKGTNISVTTHEAVHQLSINCGIQNKEVEYPFWISEGMASNFEIQQLDKKFGPYYDNKERKELLVELVENDKLTEIREFLAITFPTKYSQQKKVELYSQGWAFFKFIYTRYGDEFVAYMNALEEDDSDPLATFEDIFGPAEKIDMMFRKYINIIRR